MNTKDGIAEFYNRKGFQRPSKTAASNMLASSYVWQFKLAEIK